MTRYNKMEETKKTLSHYALTCKECGKEISGFNKKQVQWNYNVHLESHKNDKKEEAKKDGIAKQRVTRDSK
jgi:hypothetical protein